MLVFRHYKPFFYSHPHMTQHSKEIGCKRIEGRNEEKIALVHKRVRHRAEIQRNRISPIIFYSLLFHICFLRRYTVQ